MKPYFSTSDRKHFFLGIIRCDNSYGFSDFSLIKSAIDLL
ncbi:hypothetical protein HPHPA5_0754 [Helicobacter pylori Hp A-5]|nr:hypothetical protein HPHPA5_0754 [Helicobacter pylori Hp A-5]